jgi:hypothetical protein
MHTPKKYIHDRLVLLLLTANTFFAILTTAIIALRYGGQRNEGFIVQYRPSLGIIGRYIRGNKVSILSFAVFSIMVLIIHTVLSVKVYPIRRHFALVVLGMGLLLILLSLVISYSLLLLP